MARLAYISCMCARIASCYTSIILPGEKTAGQKISGRLFGRLSVFVKQLLGHVVHVMLV